MIFAKNHEKMKMLLPKLKCSESSLFYEMTLLIYDDKCYLCGKFAQTARRLSRGRIDIVGHYSEDGLSVKNRIFPEGFDPNTMFWLVKDRKAFGGRSGLIPLAAEIVRGVFKPSSKDYEHNINLVCSNKELSCNSPADFVRRVSMLMKNGKKIEIES